MRIPVVIAFCLALPGIAHSSSLKPFATDGCSMWVDGTLAHPNLWRHCCVAHDLAYWIGGTQKQRKQADAAMMLCIQDAQQPLMANNTYAGVRMGGGPYWPSSYRWGYGWDYFDGRWLRGYKIPSATEQAQIEQLMPAALQQQREDARQHPVALPPNSLPAHK
jgi:hypothetical protein